MRNQQDPRVRVHFVVEGGARLYKENISHIPRVGDELRFEGDKFFRVTRIVWVYDESDNWWDGARANIGMETIDNA